MSNFTITGSITIGGTYNGLTITNGSISGVTFTATTVNATTVNASTFAGGVFTGSTFNGVTLDNTAFTSYTPAITAGSGTFTTVSGAGRYKQIGKIVFVIITITITTNGSAATDVISTLPVAPTGIINFCGRAVSVSGKMLQGTALSASVAILNYDGSYPGASGETLNVSGFYEAA